MQPQFVVPEQVLSWQPPAKTLEKRKRKEIVRMKESKIVFDGFILFYLGSQAPFVKSVVP